MLWGSPAGHFLYWSAPWHWGSYSVAVMSSVTMSKSLKQTSFVNYLPKGKWEPFSHLSFCYRGHNTASQLCIQISVDHDSLFTDNNVLSYFMDEYGCQMLAHSDWVQVKTHGFTLSLWADQFSRWRFTLLVILTCWLPFSLLAHIWMLGFDTYDCFCKNKRFWLTSFKCTLAF